MISKYLPLIHNNGNVQYPSNQIKKGVSSTKASRSCGKKTEREKKSMNEQSNDLRKHRNRHGSVCHEAG